MIQDLQIMQTKDGSHTLWVPDLKESFHSLHGAITESQHVFITHGLNHFSQSTNNQAISILEVGFGTGLNALLTCHYCQENKQQVEYTTLEPFPIGWELAGQLNYAQFIAHPQAAFWFKELHKTAWGQIEWLCPYFSVLKLKKIIQEHTNINGYDVCYFDAFAPNKQPELWEMKVLEGVCRSLKSQGILVTYCAQGNFKRNLIDLGFRLESLPGPPGKKEITRAIRRI